MRESAKKRDYVHSLKMNYACKPEFFGNRWEERNRSTEEYHRLKQKTWKEEREKTRMLTKSMSEKTLRTKLRTSLIESRSDSDKSLSSSSLLKTVLGVKPTRARSTLLTDGKQMDLMNKLEKQLKQGKRRNGKKTREGMLGKGDYTFSDELIRFDWDRLMATGLEYK